jgi:hypothetical protein
MRIFFHYFNSSPEVIRLTVMLSIRYPSSLRQVEDILFELAVTPGRAIRPYQSRPIPLNSSCKSAAENQKELAYLYII